MMKVLKKKRKGGFTLIELIVVIAILGILAAIAIPRLGGFRTSAAERADQATGRIIAGAVSMYQAQHGTVTTTIADLVPTYIDETPVPESGGTAFTISATATGDITISTNATTPVQVYPIP